ncbi:YceI family protein [Parapedobacter defluvii]|uniref:YceI family protein n=1 Tax=Parapedobacter defluvii TaxID=2045106 RepID=UPI00333F20E8
MKATIYIPPLSILLSLGMLGSLTSFRSMESRDEGSSSLHWNVLPSSSIAIKGSSNVNTFGCDASGTFNAQPLVGILAKNGKSLDMKGSISIAINQFDCGNRMLTSDLRKTLKADEYPQMTIHFVWLERMPLCDGGEDFISGRVIIELAGQRKPFYLRYAFSKTSSGYKLQGSRAFTFADFNLSPPKKVGGLVKVKDDFDVAFTLLLDNCK